MTRSDWLGSMASRVFLILLIGIVTAATLAFTVADLQRREGERRGREQRMTDRVADLAVFLNSAPRSLRPRLLGPGPEEPRWAATDAIPGTEDKDLTQRLAARLGTHARAVATVPLDDTCRPQPARPGPEPAPPPPPVPLGGRADRAPPPPPACRLIRMSLTSGERVAFVLPTRPKPPRPAQNPLTSGFLAILALTAAALAYVVARVATAPLRRLSKAAGDLGRDLDRRPLSLDGPSEVRQAAEAFNAMQVRLKRHLAERTQMLAAITHDLQTPMTRQRLRLEKVNDLELRAQLLADQAAMLEMIRDGLDLARAAGSAEAMQELDVDSLLQSLCEDAAELGVDVSIAARCEYSVRTRPQALKRCVSNLLDNALKYAGAAEMSARVEGSDIAIRVSDRGPGIAPDQLDAVFEPFARLETSRSRATGGVGLGLTIARLLGERAGASLTLRAREGGGLEATLLIQRS